MAWFAALPVLSQAAIGFGAVTTVAGIRQADAAGKFNKAAADRTANVKEQEALALQNQLDFDLKQFDKDYIKLVGQTNVAISKSNVVLGEGTALRIARKNAEEAELQKNVMTYNSKVAQSQKIEDANFARIQGTIAKQQSTMQKIQLASSFGTSLLTSGQKTT
jgi:hypothetical protein